MILKDMIRAYEMYANLKEHVIVGNETVDIEGLNLCNRESSKQRVLSYAVSDNYVDAVSDANHVMVLVLKDNDIDIYKSTIDSRNGAIIISENPEQFFYGLHEYLYKYTRFYDKYDFDSTIGENCKIAESVIIERGVIIGNNVTIGHLSVIKHGTVIDDNVVIGCNTTIGSEGFQLITDDELPPLHISHTGGCHICKNVYIGDNSCICNSLFEGTTFIGENVKIDNLVHIAHNLYVEKNAVITAHVIICGSARIEEGAWIAPNTSIINRVTIGKHSKVGLGSVVTRDVAPYTVVYGSPAKEH